jgi:uncharacterized protein YrrD
MTDNKSAAPEDLGAPVSYLVLGGGTPVYDRSGAAVGTVEHVLRDERSDVFHGLILKTRQDHRYAPADLVDGLYEHGVIVAKPAAELPAPSADPAAQAVENATLVNELKRAWDWIIKPQ